MTTAPHPQHATPASVAAEHPDARDAHPRTVLFTNGRFWLGAGAAEEERARYAEAVVAVDGEIAFVGSAPEAAAAAESLAESTAESLAETATGSNSDSIAAESPRPTPAGASRVFVEDLGDKLVLPGFIDAHTHLLMLGESLTRADLRTAGSLDEILERLDAHAAAHSDAARLIGQGWLFDAVPGGRPTRQMLDARFPGVPVYLISNDVHSAWVNSAALEELGVDGSMPDPHGGRISRDADGVADGMLFETAATEIVWPFLDRVTTDEQRDAALAAAFEAYTAAGVTGVVDMMMNDSGLDALVRAKERLGTLPVRVAAHWFVGRSGSAAEDLAQVERAIGLAREHAGDDLAVVGIKIVVDGTIDACTAAMIHPYANGSSGEPIWNVDALAPVITAADAAGLQIAVHAIGDLASDIALDAFERAFEVNGDRPRRHRIEHLETVTRENVARLARLGITASMQPVHTDPAILANWVEQLGDERADRGFPWREFMDAGATVAFGTDAPTAPHSQLHNVYVAATRASAIDRSLPAVRPDAALTVAEAVANSTLGSAASLGATIRGRVEGGASADFAVIDADPFSSGATSLLDARVVATFARGRATHRR